jgi:transcriptional regulator with XRE-family HTH domain
MRDLLDGNLSSAMDLMRVLGVACHAMNAPRGLRQVIGARVKHVREQAGGRQEDIARVARSFGLAWPRQKVDELERGKKAISVEELVLLPFVLSHALDRTVSTTDLFDADDQITLSAQTDIPARDVLAELCGTKPAGTFIHLTHLPSFDAVEVIARAFARPVRRLEALGLGGMSSRDLLAIERSSGEPEARAARQVGEGSIVFTAICYHLWGRSLSAERDARVAASLPDAALASTVRAKRGRVTRDLVAEIRAFITRAEEI